jgi:hypothetical protein
MSHTGVNRTGSLMSCERFRTACHDFKKRRFEKEASERALRQSSPRLQWIPLCADMGGL